MDYRHPCVILKCKQLLKWAFVQIQGMHILLRLSDQCSYRVRLRMYISKVKCSFDTLKWCRILNQAHSSHLHQTKTSSPPLWTSLHPTSLSNPLTVVTRARALRRTIMYNFIVIFCLLSNIVLMFHEFPLIKFVDCSLYNTL